MDWIEPALQQGGVTAVIAIIISLAILAGVLIVLSNSKSNKQQSVNMGAVIHLSTKIADNSDRVTSAVEEFATGTKEAFTAISDELRKAGECAKEERAENAKQLSNQFSQVQVLLTSIQKTINGGVTAADFKEFSNDIRGMVDSVIISVNEIKTTVIKPDS